MEDKQLYDELFRLFVMQQQQLVMMLLGKLVNPQTNEITRDLDSARVSIDLLGMLEAKTKGNLSSDEQRLLGQVLTTLRLNFVEEAARKPAESSGAPTGGGDRAAGDRAAGEGLDEAAAREGAGEGAAGEGAKRPAAGEPGGSGQESG
jgi:hypothetical protein